MQRKARKAYVPGLVALLVAVAAGCTGAGDGGGSPTDPKPGGPTPVASPGKYRTLREPCGSVPLATLQQLLPTAPGLAEEQQEKIYRGTAAVTYDTDRRVGCSWKADSPDASHQLVIDVERVVSYDPAVSDDDRAQEVYARKETAAELPAPGNGDSNGDPAGSPSPDDTSTDGTSPDDTSTASGATTQTVSPSATTSPSAGASGASGAPGTPGAPVEGLQPRVLDGLGDAAFLDDAVARSGSAAQNRTVSVVFRTSNVIVTLQYTEQPAHPTDVPDSAELQERARGLARKLADQMNE
ncbi:DUF3558 domain-containing protein [Streptomyces sp. NBC_01317]|uniref:DUF3558 domain-containing protein n=1 Tax=Streptomyces sp. NBC_01317 TaxID=2903822 RepID=UPI002E0DEB70|nr:DUF3558 domain-containing protein [Streptomyces sp. NBC_01317]